MPTPPAPSWRSEFVVFDGIRTHYLAAGEGQPLLLLHSGEFGADAVLSWEYLIGPLARRHRVIAPDWLGYGKTDLLHDFSSKRRRMLDHLRRFLEVLSVGSVDVVANSMGASFVMQELGDPQHRLPVARFVSISGGGFVPANEYRRALVEYDCTVEGMRRLVGALFHHPLWSGDDDYIRRRYEASIRPGAWEAVAVARFKAPHVPPRSDFGQVDTVAYENITVPTLLIAGAEDTLREPGYTDPLLARIPDVRLVTVPGTGHCPNIEAPAPVLAAIEEFLDAPSTREESSL